MNDLPSKLSYLEIGTQLGAPFTEFFSQLFGWTFHPFEDAGNGGFETPWGKAGLHPDDASPGITAYFLTRDRDIEQTALQVVALGGRANPIGALQPGFGRFCQGWDPQGVPFGLHEADPSL